MEAINEPATPVLSSRAPRIISLKEANEALGITPASAKDGKAPAIGTAVEANKAPAKVSSGESEDIETKLPQAHKRDRPSKKAASIWSRIRGIWHRRSASSSRNGPAKTAVVYEIHDGTNRTPNLPNQVPDSLTVEIPTSRITGSDEISGQQRDLTYEELLGRMDGNECDRLLRRAARCRAERLNAMLKATKTAKRIPRKKELNKKNKIPDSARTRVDGETVTDAIDEPEGDEDAQDEEETTWTSSVKVNRIISMSARPASKQQDCPFFTLAHISKAMLMTSYNRIEDTYADVSMYKLRDGISALKKCMQEREFFILCQVMTMDYARAYQTTRKSRSKNIIRDK